MTFQNPKHAKQKLHKNFEMKVDIAGKEDNLKRKKYKAETKKNRIKNTMIKKTREANDEREKNIKRKYKYNTKLQNLKNKN